MRRLLPWHAWNPGLDNGERTLREVLETLPAAPPGAIPWIVRLLENPESPVAFPGAVSLARHDAIHALLGRGLRNQDEAFVVGYTMGAAKTLKAWQFRVFRWVARLLYPRPYRFSPGDLVAFDLGYAKGLRSGARDVHEFPFEDHLDRTLDDLRRTLRVDVLQLHSVYRAESALIPASGASRRLDLDYGGVDPSDLLPPDGPESDPSNPGGRK